MIKKIGKNILLEIETSLPEIKKIHPMNEIDYYGFSAYLANKLSLQKIPKSIVGFIHAWMHGDFIYAEEITHGVTRSNYLVSTKREKDFLISKNIKNTEAVGLPFIYLDDKDFEVFTRYENSLLVMPPHSLPASSHKWEEECYINEILAINEQFDIVVFCVHQSCIQKGLWINTLKKYNIPWVTGADASDENSLFRMKVLFKSFEYMTTNTFGSHIAYAAYSGCKVSIFGNFCEFKDDDFRNLPSIIQMPFLLDNLINVFSEKYIKKNFAWLFKKPKEADLEIEWANQMLGVENKVSYTRLAELLGWFCNEFSPNFSTDKINFSKNFNKFYNFVEVLKKMNKKYIIYGAGTVGKTIGKLLDDKFVTFIDITSSNISKDIVKGEVYSPNNLNNMAYDFIIISVLGREKEIKLFLNEKLNIDMKKIIEFDKV